MSNELETRDWLNQRAAAYAEVQPVDDGGKLPDGMYLAEITSCGVVPSKSTESAVNPGTAHRKR